MPRLFSVFIWLVGLPLSLIAQNDSSDPILFTFGDQAVRLSEFEYVYKKNNINDENAYTRQSLEEYLQLYINFRLKVKEAEALGMDTLKSIQEELAGYRTQLAKSYMQDREVTEQLLQEAYERMKTEVRASHILFRIEGEGLPSDTLKAYRKALDYRKRILNGEDFEKLAREVSADPSAKENGGDIGYFSVLQTVYPFETAAYNTKVGEISLPVRTRFGYHLIKVTDKRPAQGKITVAHILIKVPDNATEQQEQEARKKAEDIYQRLQEGESFEELARKFSEDKLSAGKGGVLPEFGTGKMVLEFEKAAFALQKDGDISQPVRTKYGWHIIKRISKTGIPPYEEAKVELRKKIERDSRSELAQKVLVDRIKKENGFKEYPKNKEELFEKIQSEINTTSGKITIPDKEKLTKPLFELAARKYTQADFAIFAENQKGHPRNKTAYEIFSDIYEKFVEDACLKYQDSQLEARYPEFKALMQEYHDGTLLFALTDQKVWTKALQDTAGLRAFHEQHKYNYMWDQRLDAVIYTAKNQKAAKTARKLAAKSKLDVQAILNKVNAKDTLHPVLSAQQGIFEKGQHPLIDKVEWKQGLSPDFINADSTISFVHVRKVIPPTPKSLEEARGFIISDYQEYLEKQWIAELREKYPVKINYEVLERLIRKN
ncbi:MAG: peptidyl-prolyl cis-trans isomerase [Chitinophagales bacterium]|nr:MAG: peptidyl-prolyl cis-trans isomerase [Chitinophagales bacterium]